MLTVSRARSDPFLVLVKIRSIALPKHSLLTTRKSAGYAFGSTSPTFGLLLIA
jgi:hypothetical protein